MSKITKSAVIASLIELGPNANYKELLFKDFSVATPDNTPKYQSEYLYKYALAARAERMPEAEILDHAAAQVAAFVERFPEVAVVKAAKAAKAPKEPKPVVEKTEKVTKVKTTVPDGVIMWSEAKKIFLLFVGGKILSRGKTVEKVKEIATAKHNFTAFVH